MYAVFVEVDTGGPDVDLEQARARLNEIAVPLARNAGALAGYWLAPANGRVNTVAVFDSEQEANDLAKRFQVGSRPPAAPEDSTWTFRLVEVREVLASL
jgi:hypothetical protein